MDEFLDEGPEFVVQGYQFEPIRPTVNATHIDNSSSEDEEDHQDSVHSEPVPDNTDWCICDHCLIMETARECKCCLWIPDVAMIVRQENLECITKHESFVVNCLNHHVLEVSYFEYIQDNGPIGNDEPVHELYRHLAYRRFARFIWKRLGRHNRRILPSCVVTAIRNQQACL